ncbi:hypothetical protein GF324_09560 [bacterium]|nr:hypothetical protein [bacterium]
MEDEPLEVKHSEYMCKTCGASYGAPSLYAVVREAAEHGISSCSACGGELRIFITLNDPATGRTRGKLAAAYRPGIRPSQGSAAPAVRTHVYLVLLQNRKQGVIPWHPAWKITEQGRRHSYELGHWDPEGDTAIAEDLYEQAERDGRTLALPR